MEAIENTRPVGLRENLQNVLKFLVLLKPYWRNITVFIFSGLILTVLALPFPWLTKMMIDDVMLRQDQSLLYVILVATFILVAVRAVLSSLREYFVSYVQHKMAFDIEFSFFRHLQKLSFSFYDKREGAEVLSRLRDAAQSRRILIDIINTIITNLLYLSIVPVIVFFINWKLALIAGVTLPWMAFSFLLLSRIVKKYSRLSAEKRAEVSARNYEFVSGIREIQSLVIEGRILKRIRHLYLKFRKTDMILRTFGIVQGAIGALVTGLGTMLYTWYGATLVISGRMSVGELMAFTTFIGYLYSPLTSTVELIVPIQEVLVYTKRFYEIFDLQPDVADPPDPVPVIGLQGYVTFSGVNFGYRSDRPVLKEIDLDIPAGSRVAIVGETGSGKSTIVSLLPRFYDPQSGSIKIDGHDIRDLSLKDLRSGIGIVRQHPFLFFGSIYDNITSGRFGFSRRQVVAAARAANAHNFITALPKGYDTLVGEKGATLSGGERQRIAMARVFLLDRPILILDEPTSNIDQKTEALIQEALERVTAGRTTFIIAHRLTTIEDADIILVMHCGRIVEKGNHSELMANKSLYFQLHNRASITESSTRAD